MEHVIAMDPGGRSGWASAMMDVDHLALTGGGVLRQDLMADWFAEQQAITYMGPPFPKSYPVVRTFDRLVYETWYPRRQNGSMNWIEGDELLSAQHVGQVLWIARISGTAITDQHPSDKPEAVATMPDVLKELDVYSNEQHDQDARQHLWLYFFREYFTATRDPEHVVFT